MINVAKLKMSHGRMMAAFTHAVKSSMDEAGSAILGHVKSDGSFKDRSGGLRRSITAQTKMGRGRLWAALKARSRKKYARVVESGSKPHLIFHRKKQALRFRAGGDVVFAKIVFHPGTKATRFLWRATQHGGEQLQRRLARRFSNLSKRRF